MMSMHCLNPRVASLYMSSVLFDEKLAVFQHLSPSSKQAIQAYIDLGNPDLRTKRMLEFFKSLDWLPISQIENNPIKKLDENSQCQIYEEIKHYFATKAEHRQKKAEQRKEYQLAIIEYYRRQLSSQDKALLESLRDYELDLTGRDVNWQHYFSLNSFKKIDAFMIETPRERKTRIEQFKTDVLLYKKNKEKLESHTHCSPDEAEFNFDDWCDWYSSSNPGNVKVTSRQAGLQKAYEVLNLPLGSDFTQVKKQFRLLTLQYHPDMPTGNADKMKTLLQAYEALKSALTTTAELTPV